MTRRVLEGGVGATRGGMVERSIDIFDFLDKGRDDGGELCVDIFQDLDDLLGTIPRLKYAQRSTRSRKLWVTS